MVYNSSILHLLTAVFLAVGPSFAEIPSGEALSLEDCVRIALEKSPDLAVAKRRLEQAQATRRKAYAPFSPQGSLTASQTQLGTDAAGIRNKGNRWDNNTRSASVNATWNMFNGFRDWDRWSGARYDENAGAESMEAARHQIALQVVQAYYGLLVSEKSIAAQTEDLESKKQHHDLAQARFKAGVRSYSDVLNAQIQMKQSEIRLIDAGNQRDKALHALNSLLDIPLANPTRIIDVVKFEPVTENLEGSLKIAFARRPEILQAEAQVKSAEAARRLASHDFLPVLTAGGLYNYTVAGTPASSYALGSMLNPYWQVNLGLSFPFWDGGTRVQEIRRSRAAVDENNENLRKVRRTVGLEVSSASLSLERNRKVHQIAGDQVRAAREDLAIISERYKNGGTSVLDVVDAQANLLRIQLDAIQSLFDFHVAKHDLRRAMGLEPLPLAEGGVNEDR